MSILKDVDIMSAYRKGKKSISVSEGVIVTPLARETADSYGIKITEDLMRKPLIAGNWKMNKTNQKAVELVSALKEKVSDVTDVDIVVAPPYTALSLVNEVIKDSNIELSSQNIYFEKNGAFTGEISGAMLKSCGCQLAIIGHSERRQYFGCTDEIVNKKIKAAALEGITPIVCIGETLQERESEKTWDVLKTQVTEGLKNLTDEERKGLIVAYEPVWAIGTGKTATSQQAEEAHKFVRSILSEMYGAEFADSTRILYGGSMKPANVSELMANENVDGGLVGGASLEADSFESLVKFNK
jgi:triosephosphate isomerase